MYPAYDSIVILKQQPYRQWRMADKIDLLKQGKQTPVLTCVTAHKQGSKIFSRYFNSKLYNQHEWLCGSFYLQKLFCWPCVLFSRTKSVWTSEGYCDFKNVSRSIRLHKARKDHVSNFLNLKHLENKFKAYTDLGANSEHDRLFKSRYNENVRLNRLVMEHLIDLVIYLAQQESVLNDYNDDIVYSLNKVNFNELCEFHFNRCSFEVQHSYKTVQAKFTDTSKIIQNDIILYVSDYLADQIKQEIKQCMFYSIQIYDTTDLTQKSQLCIVLRYINSKCDLVDRFFGFYDSEDRTSEGVFNLITNILHEFSIENKLVGQYYDAACVMTEYFTKLQTRIKEIAPNAFFTHCLSHRLNLVLQHGCNYNEKCRIFFANMTGISTYFNNSSSHTSILNSVLGNTPQIIQSKWAFGSEILQLLVNEWTDFKVVFETIINDPKSSPKSICSAVGHLNNLKSFEFAFLANIFCEIFSITEYLFKILQIRSFDIEYCLKEIKTTCNLIGNKRNEMEFFNLFNKAVGLTKLPETSINNSNNELNFKNEFEETKNNFEILFYEIIDSILMQLRNIFIDTDKLIFIQLADVSKFKDYGVEFPTKAFDNLKKICSNIFEDFDKLKVELEVFYNDVNYHHLPHIYDMIKIFENEGLKEVMPEVYRLFSLILTIPSTDVSVMGNNFSCLKRIATLKRNNITEQCSSFLSIIPIEKLFVQQMKENEQFYGDIINLYASQDGEKTINLIYKT